jgi:hypothetical protein
MLNVFTHKNAIGSPLDTWTDLSRPVGRRLYVTHGLALAAAKYLGDLTLVYAATGTLWLPTQYVQALPSLLVRWQSSHAAWWLAPALLVWMIPFVAIGMTLTLRRAVDAGRSPWLSILFLVPYVNYALMAALSAMPTGSAMPLGSGDDSDRTVTPSRMNDLAARIVAGGAGVAIALTMVTLSAASIRISSYGGWLFVVTPCVIGACTAFIYNRNRDVSSVRTMSLVVATVLAGGGALLLVALEGAICLLMSLPLTIPLAVLGGVVGRRAARQGGGQPASVTFMLLALPLTAVMEPASGRALHEVRSSVVIDAPPDAVWPHVVTFREIPGPTDWLSRAGVAYPIRARIDGSGVGAVRYCVFSTGAFVEPITRWEPGRRLSFDVVESPAPMRELSPYRDLSPPHLHGYLRSRRGEFRFVDLGGGRTRLEGSTWYEIEMAPEGYWQIFSDALIHRIHLRVLQHIKAEVETR